MHESPLQFTGFSRSWIRYRADCGCMEARKSKVLLTYLRAACMSSGLHPSTPGALLSSRPRLFSVKPHDCSAATAASSCASGKVSRAAGKAATTRLIWPGDRPSERRSLTCRLISNLIRLQYGVLRATSTDATHMTVRDYYDLPCRCP
jgi:hypothetical protein